MRIAGIGSRETPPDVLQEMTNAAYALSSQGHCGTSGGARGADAAFEAGFANARHLLRSYTTHDVNGRTDLLELAAHYHPAWDRCSDYAKLLHARNGLIVLGDDLNSPVDVILCWTPCGRITGGTGQALRIATDERWRIPVFNLAVNTIADLYQWMWENA